MLFDDAGSAYLSDFAVGTADGCSLADDVRDFAALIEECLTRHRAARSGAGAGSGNERLPARVADILSRAAAPSAGPTIGELVPALVAALTGKAEPSAAAVPNPYKGLRAFDESDAVDFYGRDDLVADVLARLDPEDGRGRLVLVVGGSGSGKSSLVRAGLLPRVRRGAVPGSDRWFVTTMLPGASPFKELAEGLRRVAVVDTDGLYDELASGAAGVDGVLRRLLPDGGQLLLVVDQLEELFTLATEAEQRAFLDGLLHAVTAPDSRLRVVATLRADFYDQPLRFHRFGAVVRDATVPVPAMSAAELEAAIAGPPSVSVSTSGRGWSPSSSPRWSTSLRRCRRCSTRSTSLPTAAPTAASPWPPTGISEASMRPSRRGPSSCTARSTTPTGTRCG